MVATQDRAVSAWRKQVQANVKVAGSGFPATSCTPVVTVTVRWPAGAPTDTVKLMSRFKLSGEVGHPSYQHPQRLREGTYSPEVDRFPVLLVATALRALKTSTLR